MDKVLKRRLIGASILIALAVIFLPMLLVDPDSVPDGDGGAIDVPPMPDSAREIRRIPLDPEAARVAPAERASAQNNSAQNNSAQSNRGQAPTPDEAPSRMQRVNPDEQIVLRPDLAEPDSPRIEDESPAAGEDTGDNRVSGAETGSAESPGAAAQAESGPAAEREPDRAQSPDDSGVSMGDWVVQVASFGSQDAADQVRARLEALGHIVARDEIVRGQSLLYRLRTGPYPSRAAAEEALAQISATVAGVEPIVREIGEAGREGMQPGFAVQVGSFVSEDNADSEAARLAGLGFESFRFSERIGERLIWRVMVGPVSERDEADELQSRVVEQAGVEGLVVSHP